MVVLPLLPATVEVVELVDVADPAMVVEVVVVVVGADVVVVVVLVVAAVLLDDEAGMVTGGPEATLTTIALPFANSALATAVLPCKAALTCEPPCSIHTKFAVLVEPGPFTVATAEQLWPTDGMVAKYTDFEVPPARSG